MLEGLAITNPTEDEIILYGPQEKRTQARRIIATFYLPRPGILMEMWGVQITSKNPENMAKVMTLVRQEINRTQQTVREVYGRLELLTRQEISQEQAERKVPQSIGGRFVLPLGPECRSSTFTGRCAACARQQPSILASHREWRMVLKSGLMI